MLNMFRGWWQRGRSYPNAEWLVSANGEATHTPDLLDLESRSLQLLFLPCELQERHPQSKLISDAGVCLYHAFTKNSFSLYRNREDNSAIFTDEPQHSVKGEVWAILPKRYSVLDKYKENGVRCVRKPIDVRVPFTRFIKGNHSTKVQSEIANLKMWAYVSPNEIWADELDGGYLYPQVTLHRPNNPFLSPFYYYRPNEYKK